MRVTPRVSATCFSWRAVSNTSCSDSITHGPAMTISGGGFEGACAWGALSSGASSAAQPIRHRYATGARELGALHRDREGRRTAFAGWDELQILAADERVR